MAGRARGQEVAIVEEGSSRPFDRDRFDADFEAKHPRHPAGSEKGGEFREEGESSLGSLMDQGTIGDLKMSDVITGRAAIPADDGGPPAHKRSLEEFIGEDPKMDERLGAWNEEAFIRDVPDEGVRLVRHNFYSVDDPNWSEGVTARYRYHIFVEPSNPQHAYLWADVVNAETGEKIIAKGPVGEFYPDVTGNILGIMASHRGRGVGAQFIAAAVRATGNVSPGGSYSPAGLATRKRAWRILQAQSKDKASRAQFDADFEAKHPRHPAGSEKGGEFKDKDEADAEATEEPPAREKHISLEAHEIPDFDGKPFVIGVPGGNKRWITWMQALEQRYGLEMSEYLMANHDLKGTMHRAILEDSLLDPGENLLDLIDLQQRDDGTWAAVNHTIDTLGLPTDGRAFAISGHRPGVIALATERVSAELLDKEGLLSLFHKAGIDATLHGSRMSDRDHGAGDGWQVETDFGIFQADSLMDALRRAKQEEDKMLAEAEGALRDNKRWRAIHRARPVAEKPTDINVWESNLTRAQREGIRTWKDSSRGIRIAQKSGSLGGRTELGRNLAALNRAIESAPRMHGEIWRGINTDFSKNREMVKTLLESEGKTFELQTHSSFSEAQQVARGFTGQGMRMDDEMLDQLGVDLPAPASGAARHAKILFRFTGDAGVRIGAVQQFTEEQEALLPRGTRVRVVRPDVGAIGSKPIVIINLEQVDGQEDEPEVRAFAR